MDGSKRTARTEKRNGPRWSGDRFKKQNPRRTNNEEFAMTILSTNPPTNTGRIRVSDGAAWGWPVAQ
jgi:hypothetical protein